jgi:integrase
MHDLRRTLAIRTYNRNHDLREVQRVLGHASLGTTLKYLKHFEHADLAPMLNELRAPHTDWKN